MINLEIDAKSLDRLVVDLDATDEQAKKALNTTLNKMATWLKGKSAKGLSGELGMQQKIIRRRIKNIGLTRRGNGSEIAVWYGLNPVALIYLQARQTKRGVKASGGRFVDGGFIANGKNSNRQVFKRRGKERLPIDKQRAEVEDKAGAFIENNLLGASEFDARFFQIFEHELKWQTRTP